MSTRWRTRAAHQLSRLVVQSGGKAQKISLGRMLITGPTGQVVIPEPDGEVCGFRHSAVLLVQERTGLEFTTAN